MTADPLGDGGLYEVRCRDSDGRTVMVPLHEIEVVRDGRVHARFRQNGWIASPAFAAAMGAPLVPVDRSVLDLGEAHDV